MLLARKSGEPEGQRALEQLCQLYWYPLYAYIRRQGRSPHNAEDLTQAFFAHLLARKDLAGVDPRKGKFRSFLLGSMQHFLANEWDRAQAQKRGGGKAIISLDEQTAEHRFQIESPASVSPESAFDKEWAAVVFEKAREGLREEFRKAGKLERFEALQAFLLGESDAAPYAAVAEHLRLSEGAVKVAVLRMRRRFLEFLREAVKETVADPAEVDDEIRYLLTLLRDDGA